MFSLPFLHAAYPCQDGAPPASTLAHRLAVMHSRAPSQLGVGLKSANQENPDPSVLPHTRPMVCAWPTYELHEATPGRACTTAATSHAPAKRTRGARLQHVQASPSCTLPIPVRMGHPQQARWRIVLLSCTVAHLRNWALASRVQTRRTLIPACCPTPGQWCAHGQPMSFMRPRRVGHAQLQPQATH